MAGRPKWYWTRGDGHDQVDLHFDGELGGEANVTRRSRKEVPSEKGWLGLVDPEAIWRCFDGHDDCFALPPLSERRARLLALAIVRATYTPNQLEAHRRAIDIADRFAEGKASQIQLDDAYYWNEPGCHVTYRSAQRCMRWVLRADMVRTQPAVTEHLMREVIGNPFRPVMTLKAATINVLARAMLHAASRYHDWTRKEEEAQILLPEMLGWNDSKPVRLAEHIYETRDFDTMPILGDALEEAGCINQDVLAHCRGPGPHCRGCWLLDALLGKE